MGGNRNAVRQDRIDDAITITGLSHDGRGLARYKGKALFVDGALKNETVRVHVTEQKRRFINARTSEVLDASSERCDPPCRYFKTCGGCSLQFWSHEGQLNGKQEIVIDQLKRFASIVPEELAAALVSEPYGYRHRCRLAMKWKKGQLSLGFREKSSQTICSIDECLVLVESLRSLPGQLREFLPSLKAREAISHAELLAADNGSSLLLRHIRPLTEEDNQKLITFAEKNNLNLYLQDRPDNVQCLFSPADNSWLLYSLPDFNIEMAFQPQDFTQVNGLINQKMIVQAVNWLDLKSEDKVIDLFCGIGNFSLPLACKAAAVTGIEGSCTSVERAKENALRNGISNAEFHTADLSGILLPVHGQAHNMMHWFLIHQEPVHRKLSSNWRVSCLPEYCMSPVIPLPWPETRDFWQIRGIF